jgi:predicted ATPase
LNAQLKERRLAVLVSGGRDSPTRHRTLRAAVGWSYDLLNAPQKQLFRRLGVFAGGCTLTAAVAVCDLADDPLDTLTELIDRSLLVSLEDIDGNPRFVMLDTIREFALEGLQQSDECQTIRDAHAREFLRLWEQAARSQGAHDEPVWLARIAVEHDNLRAAMRWVLDSGDMDVGLRMADAAWRFLNTYGYAHEGVQWLDEVLRISVRHPAAGLRAKVAVGAGWLNHQLGDLHAAERFFREALQVGRATGDLRLVTFALCGLAPVVHEQGNFIEAERLSEENLAAAISLGEQSRLGRALTTRAELLVMQGQFVRGGETAERAIATARAIGDYGCVAAARDVLGLARRLSGNVAEAVELLETAVRMHEKLGYKANAAEALLRWADALLLSGDVNKATAQCVRGLQFAYQAGNQHRIATGLRVAAALAVARGEYERALTLAGAAEALYARLGIRLTPVERADFGAVLAGAEQGLGHVKFEAMRRNSDEASVDTIVADLLVEAKKD